MNIKTALAVPLAASLAVALPSAHASDWRHIANSQNNDIILIDASSIHFSGSHVKAWFLDNYASPEAVPMTYPQKFAGSLKQLNLFDCDQGTWGVAQTVYTSLSSGMGEVLKSFSIPPSAVQYEDVVPDSVGEIMLSYVCATRPSSSTKHRKAGSPPL